MARVFGALVGGRNGIVPTGSLGQGTECAAGRRRPVAEVRVEPPAEGPREVRVAVKIGGPDLLQSHTFLRGAFSDPCVIG